MAIPATSMREARLDAMRYRWRQLNSSVDLSKVQSVDQRMRLECGVGFRQLRTCRRTRPGQLCTKLGHPEPDPIVRARVASHQ